MLNFINLRLQEIMGNSLDFGGISVLAGGDFYQLKPVFDDRNIWKDLFLNFFQSKTYLFTDWLVEHHTFASSTFYSFCDNILNGNFHPWTTDHLGTTEQPNSTSTNISMDHRSFGHH
jgi:hypothetical protein